MTQTPSSVRWGVLLLLTAWLLPGVVGHDPWVPDEGYTYGLIHSIATDGDMVVPRLAGDPFLEKPPLYYWTASGLLRLFSPPLPPHDAARLATPLFLALTLLFTGLLGRETWGGRAGWVTPLLLISAPGMLSHRHLMVTDMALLAGMAMGSFGLLLARRSIWLGGLWLGTGVGVAFLAKGLLGPGVLGLSALLLPLFFSVWRSAVYFKALAASIPFALPWLVTWPAALYLRSPDLFMLWFWDNNLGRYLGFSDLGPPAKTGYWWRNLPLFTFPMLPLAAWYLWCKRRSAPWNAGVQLAAVVSLLSVLVLVTASTAQGFYLLPILPLLALPASAALPLLPGWVVTLVYYFGILIFGLLASILWGIWAYTALRGYPPPIELLKPFALLSEQILVGPERLLLAVAYTFIGLIIVFRLRPPQRAALVSWPVGIAMVLGVAFSLYLSTFNQLKSFRGVAQAVAQQLPEAYDCIADINLHENERGILHATEGITTEHILHPHETRCPFILVHTFRRYYPDGMNFGKYWQEIWRGHRFQSDDEIYYLFRRLPRPRKKKQ